METINNNFCSTCGGFKSIPASWSSWSSPKFCTCSNGTLPKEIADKTSDHLINVLRKQFAEAKDKFNKNMAQTPKPTAEEFFRKKLKETTSFREPTNLATEWITAETAMIWAKKYSDLVQEKDTPKEDKPIDVSNLNKKCVYWRWKEKSSCLSKSYVRNVIETQQGATIIELANDEYSNALHRVLLSEIEIYTL